MPTGVYKRDKSWKNLFQKGFKPWNTGLRYKGKPHPELLGKKFGTPFPKGNIPWNKQVPIKVLCPQCKTPFLKTKKLSKKYCSKFCYWKALSEKSPSLHPRWKGGLSKNREYQRKRAKERGYGLSWKLKNKERICFYSKMRAFRERNTPGYFSLEDWKRLKQYCTSSCVCCGRFEPEIKLTIDHIKPLIKGGTNYIENIQPLCGSCNSKKSTREIKFIGMPREERTRLDFLK